MPELNRLRKEHVNLAAIAGRLSTLIAKKAPPPSQELYLVRMQLGSALLHHLKSEDWVLYPRLWSSSDKRTAVTARVFSAEMGGLSERFKNYTQRWNTNSIESAWELYQNETQELLKALALRMEREERDLYPLLETPALGAA
jgi:hypothetical protein